MDNEIKRLNNESLLKLLKAVAFAAVLVSLLLLSSRVFMPKKPIVQGASPMGFYGEPKNSIDILAIGNSNIYSGFSPMELWKDRGYASYVAGQGNQDISEAYDILSSALTCQSPKLVILETDELFQKNHNIPENAIFSAFKNLFPILEFHNRWKQLSTDDFTKAPLARPWKSNSRGFSLNTAAQGYTGKEYMVKSGTSASINEATLFFLNKFVSICKEKNIPLVFVDMPCAVEWNYSKHNAVAAYAQEHSIPFLDLNLNRTDFNFNWLQNTRDKGDHLNASGAEKVTSYLGKYISKYFSIPNRSMDAAYQSWNKDLLDYEKKVK